ncbi:MAG: aspartate-semialdehyde dehydrogenase [Firmicutes bacterium]|nr:aspartate-semialdehyde dehydrogenase [Bacillota bacterium]
MKGYKVAIVGATGVVGQELLKILSERHFPISELTLLASARSKGKPIEFQGKILHVKEVSKETLSGHDIAFFAAGSSISREFAHETCRDGVLVIDNSSAFRMDREVPLVVPQVNPEDILKHKGIIANPNCTTIIMVMALKPIDEAACVKRAVVSTYQAVSGAGIKAVNALFNETRAYLEGETIQPEALPFASASKHYQIAFNVIPQVDVFQDMMYSKEEWKTVHETAKIIGRDLKITATTVRVPIERSHSVSLNLETEKKLTREQALDILSRAPGIEVIDEPDKMLYPMPLSASGTDLVQVGRVREDNSIEKGLNLWVVGDQLRKGAALNAIEIGEKALELDVL